MILFIKLSFIYYYYFSPFYYSRIQTRILICVDRGVLLRLWWCKGQYTVLTSIYLSMEYPTPCSLSPVHRVDLYIFKHGIPDLL